MTDAALTTGLAGGTQLSTQIEAGASVDLYWLPLGAGEPLGIVRRSGRIFEAIEAHHQHRPPGDLYHSALRIRLGGQTFTIEMAPAWGNKQADRGVVSEGPVGSPSLRHSRFFRYEIRRWRGGVIPDLAQAVASPLHIATDPRRTRQLLDLVPAFPAVTWGRDDLDAGEMWNSNSLTAWLIARSGHRIQDIAIPPHGRAPGWTAGLIIAARQQAHSHNAPGRTGCLRPREGEPDVGSLQCPADRRRQPNE